MNVAKIIEKFMGMPEAVGIIRVSSKLRLGRNYKMPWREVKFSIKKDLIVRWTMGPMEEHGHIFPLVRTIFKQKKSLSCGNIGTNRVVDRIDRFCL